MIFYHRHGNAKFETRDEYKYFQWPTVRSCALDAPVYWGHILHIYLDQGDLQLLFCQYEAIKLMGPYSNAFVVFTNKIASKCYINFGKQPASISTVKLTHLTIEEGGQH